MNCSRDFLQSLDVLLAKGGTGHIASARTLIADQLSTSSSEGTNTTTTQNTGAQTTTRRRKHNISAEARKRMAEGARKAHAKRQKKPVVAAKTMSAGG